MVNPNPENALNGLLRRAVLATVDTGSDLNAEDTVGTMIEIKIKAL